MTKDQNDPPENQPGDGAIEELIALANSMDFMEHPKLLDRMVPLLRRLGITTEGQSTFLGFKRIERARWEERVKAGVEIEKLRTELAAAREALEVAEEERDGYRNGQVQMQDAYTGLWQHYEARIAECKQLRVNFDLTCAALGAAERERDEYMGEAGAIAMVLSKARVLTKLPERATATEEIIDMANALADAQSALKIKT